MKSKRKPFLFLRFVVRTAPTIGPLVLALSLTQHRHPYLLFTVALALSLHSHNEMHETHALTVSVRRIPVGSVFDRVRAGELDMKGSKEGK
jgi:hypothetical protein